MKFKILRIKWFSIVVFFVFFQFTPVVAVTSAENGSVAEDSIQAIAYNKKGIAAARLGDFELARDYFEKTRNIWFDLYGATSSKVAGALVNIGIQNKNLGNYDRAIEDYLEAERLYINAFSPDYSRLGFVYGNISTVYKSI
jgi:tetratricopeptide (TPR) repeat protein